MHLAFQVLRWPLGGLFYAAAILLYENQERIVQNRLEDLWLWAVDRKDAELSSAARLIQGVARLTNRAFDNVLGKRLWSLQAVGASLWFSLASIFLTTLVLAHIPRFARPTPTFHFALNTILCVSLGILPYLAGRFWAFATWTMVVLIAFFPLVGFILFVIHKYGYTLPLRVIAVVFMLLFFSFGFDVLYVSITRWMLRSMFQLRLLPELIGLVVLNVALAGALMFGPIALATILMKPYLLGISGAWSVVLVMLNFGDFIACSVFFVVMLAVLAHRLMWPIVERHIYALQRLGLIRRKWLLLSVATALWLGPKGIELVKFAMEFAH